MIMLNIIDYVVCVVFAGQTDDKSPPEKDPAREDNSDPGLDDFTIEIPESLLPKEFFTNEINNLPNGQYT